MIDLNDNLNKFLLVIIFITLSCIIYNYFFYENFAVRGRSGSGSSSGIGSGIGSGSSSRIGSRSSSRIGSGSGTRIGSGSGTRIGSGSSSRIGSRPGSNLRRTRSTSTRSRPVPTSSGARYGKRTYHNGGSYHDRGNRYYRNWYWYDYISPLSWWNNWYYPSYPIYVDDDDYYYDNDDDDYEDLYY